MNIQEAYTQFTKHIWRTRAEGTAKTYQHGFAHFVRYLEAEKITDTNELTINHFIGFIGYLLDLFENKSTRGLYIAAMNSFMDWMIIQDLFFPSPKDTLRYNAMQKENRRRRSVKLVRSPKEEDVEKIVTAVYAIEAEPVIKARNIALIELLRCTGCRVNEVIGLRRADLDLSDNSAIVTGKGSKERRVFFSELAKERLLTYWELAEIGIKEPAFIRHDDGGGKGRKKQKLTTETARQIVKDLVKFSELKEHFSPHYFRHAFASRMLRETDNLALVQDLLGHSDPKSTRVYAKFSASELKAHHKQVWSK